MATKKETLKRVVISPVDNNDYQEGYAVCGTKRIPFDTPVVLSDHDIKVIKRQKIPAQRPKRIDVRQIMDSMQISQEKANMVARQMEHDSDMKKEIYFRERYIIETV